MNAAAIDIGTNTVKLSIYDGKMRLLLRELRYLRIGEDIGKERLSTIKRQKALTIIRILIARARRRGAQKVIIVGTSALRNFKNGKDLSENVRKYFKVPFKILSGRKEAELTFLGASHGLRKSLLDKTLVFLDIGAGSSEVILARRKKVITFRCIEAGSLRAKKLFGPRASSDSVFPFLAGLLPPSVRKTARGADALVGIGGSFTTSALLLSGRRTFDMREVNRSSFTSKDFSLLEKKMSALSIDFIRKKFRLHRKRADIIRPGLALINSYLRLLEPSRVFFSTEGVGKGAVIRYLLKRKDPA